MRLSICPGCNRHVRANERTCPHCGVAFAGSLAPRAAPRVRLDARRLAVAAVLAGWSSACGGRVDDLSGAALQAQVAGSCSTSGGSMLCDATSGPGRPPDVCACGPAGTCDNHVCVPLPCAEDEHRNSMGLCVSNFWFEGKVPPKPSQGGCYGAPPARG